MDSTFSTLAPQDNDDATGLARRQSIAAAVSLGQKGGVYVADTTAQSGGSWAVIQALSDTVIATLTATGLSGTLTNIPLPAGVAIYGRFTAFTLTSGKVIAYKL